MFSMDLTTPGCGTAAVVALRGDHDVAYAAAPQRQVLRVLTVTRLIDVFGVHARECRRKGQRVRGC
jgi:hypothetical protein